MSYDSSKMSVPIYFFVVFLCFLNLGISANQVPVLLWSPTTSLSSVPALKHLSTVHFNGLLHDLTSEEQPTVAVFLEEDLSFEDFSSRSEQGELNFKSLNNLLAENNVEFAPSVANPMKAIRMLKEDGYVWKTVHGAVPSNLSKPAVLLFDLTADNDVERSEMLQSHDSKIVRLYNEIVKSYPNVISVLTGKKGGWSEEEHSSERVRRAAGDEGETEEPSGLVIEDSGVILYADSIKYYDSNNAEVILESGSSVNISAPTEDTLLWEIQFKDLTVYFNMTNNTYSWALNSIKVNDLELAPAEYVGAPLSWSYTCPKNLNFTSTKDRTQVLPVFVINGLQLQTATKDFTFGPAIDCVPYFSIGIWMGIVVIGLLLIIMAWGIIMLMDINTNDRFDDPKGKTITISATD